MLTNYKFIIWHEQVLLPLYTWYFTHQHTNDIPDLEILLSGDHELSESIFNSFVAQFAAQYDLIQESVDRRREIFLHHWGTLYPHIFEDCVTCLNTTHHFFSAGEHVFNYPTRKVW